MKLLASAEGVSVLLLNHCRSPCLIKMLANSPCNFNVSLVASDGDTTATPPQIAIQGPFPRKMLKKGIFVEKHFEDDANMSFALVEEDPVSRQPVSEKAAGVHAARFVCWVGGGWGSNMSFALVEGTPCVAAAGEQRRFETACVYLCVDPREKQ